MAIVHRHGDSRACGASTIVSGQNFVKVDGQLWSVNGDMDSHGGGSLSSSTSWISIDGKGIIIVGDSASPDNLCPVFGGAHCGPFAASGSNLVTITS